MPERTHCINENCGKLSADYFNGLCQCSECEAIWWRPFNAPHGRQKGKKCFHCGRSTLHLVAKISNVEVWRCGTCVATYLEAVEHSE